MRTREAVLPDAEQIHALIAAYSGDGTLLPRSLAEICENVRDFVVLEHDATHHRMRRSSPLWRAPGRDSFDYGRSLEPKQRRRPALGEGSSGASGKAQSQLRLSVHAHPRIFLTHGIYYRLSSGSSRQDSQRLLSVSPALSLRRNCDGSWQAARRLRFCHRPRTG